MYDNQQTCLFVVSDTTKIYTKLKSSRENRNTSVLEEGALRFQGQFYRRRYLTLSSTGSRTCDKDFGASGLKVGPRKPSENRQRQRRGKAIVRVSYQGFPCGQ